jgi:hypothetical protein
VPGRLASSMAAPVGRGSRTARSAWRVKSILRRSGMPGDREGGHVSTMDVDAPGPGAKETRRPAAAFRQHPGWVVFHAGLAALTVVTIPLCLRDPEYRAAFFFAVNPLTSLKFVMVTTLVVLGWIIYITLIVRMWRSAWTFEITPDRLIAIHQFAQRRHEIPWGSIAEVSKLPPSPFLRGARRQFSRIVLTDGTELVFYPLLYQYSEFVDELRGRVTCRVFDPYRGLV